MKIKNFEELKAYLRAQPDYMNIGNIPQDPADWEDILSVQAFTRKGEPMELVLHPDHENIYTSIANTDVKRQRFVVRQKHQCCAIPMHRHKYIEINYVAEGKLCANIDGREILMKQGDLCIMDKDVQHSSKALSKDDWIFNLIMTEEFFDTVFMYLLSDDNYISSYIVNSLYSESRQKHYLLFCLKPERFVANLVEQIICEYYSEESRNNGKIISCLVILFTELSRMVTDDSTENIARKISGVSKKLFEYLEQHYRDATLQTAADYLHFHPNYLCSLLKKETGKTFKEYVTDVRMLKATELLLTSDWKVREIAQEVGYATENYFYHQFKQKFQMSPREFRENHKKT